MAVLTDSIQTLLTQRRELRECLTELRAEITALNQKADTIVSKTETEAFGGDQTDLSDEDTPRIEREALGRPLQTTPPLIVSSPTQNSAMSEPIEDNAPRKTDKKPNEDAANAEDTKTKTTDQVTSILKATKDQIIEVAEARKNETIEVPPKEIMKEFDDIDDESLFYRAKLLSDYFSNHPSPVANEALNRLDKAIKSLNQTDPSLDNKKDVAQLRDVYREVSSKSYEKLGINGATLVDSRGEVGLLWGVPLFIAALVLVLFPLILLLRSLAERMFVADFAAELSYTLTASAGFLWGC
ncbi:MAG: hypothetical protein JKY12_04745, partial [Sneathiella sp.]|nr:hypothetical protein [Sneathiella sp.]